MTNVQHESVQLDSIKLSKSEHEELGLTVRQRS